MSGATSAILGGLITAAGVYVSYDTAQKQKKSAEEALQLGRDNARQASEDAQKVATATEQATNRASQQRASSSSALDAAKQAGKGGISGTLLTGPLGIDPTALTLGRKTLLGG